MPSLKKSWTSARPELESSWQIDAGGHVISLAWSADGARLAAATADGPIQILEAGSGKLLHTLAGHRGGTAQVAFQPGVGAGRLVSAGCDGKIRVWDAFAGQDLGDLEGGAPWVERVAFSPGGHYLASAAGKHLRLWDFRDAQVPSQPLQSYPPQQATIADIGWKPGRENLLASCGYNGLSFWSPDSAVAVREFEWKGSMLRLAWSPDAKYIATGNQDATIQFWIVATGKELHMWGYRSKIRELAWDPKSRYLASGGSSTGVVWDCSGKGPAGTKPQLLDFHSQLLSQLAYQGQGSFLASGCLEGLLAIWHPGKSEEAIQTAHLGSGVSQLVWSPDSKLLAAGTHEGRVALFPAPKR